MMRLLSGRGSRISVGSIRSHELFPFFEEFLVGSADYHSEKCKFGAAPVEDVLSWNSWLEEHGDALSQHHTVFCAMIQYKKECMQA